MVKRDVDQIAMPTANFSLPENLMADSVPCRKGSCQVFSFAAILRRLYDGPNVGEKAGFGDLFPVPLLIRQQLQPPLRPRHSDIEQTDGFLHQRLIPR
ncbi:hypothetical protein D3C76_1306580 [compost metagenome]